MMLVIVFSLMCLYYILRELRCYYRNKRWKVFYVYAVILAVSYALSVAMAAEIQISGLIARLTGK